MNNFKPMLACNVTFEYLKQNCPSKLLASPKMDGIRATVIKDDNGLIQVLGRSGKPIKNLNIQRKLGTGLLVGFDGELIVGSPTASDCYRKTQSYVNSEYGGGESFDFYVFDKCNTGRDNYGQRNDRLRLATAMLSGTAIYKHVQLMPSTVVCGIDEIKEIHQEHLKMGYEGTMLRDLSAMYKNGRSTLTRMELMKIKPMQDSEAEILGYSPAMANTNEAKKSPLGYTERSSHKANLVSKDYLGSLQVRDLVSGCVFNIGCFDGLTEIDKREMYKIGDSLIGQIVKYSFMDYGIKGNTPRFPVFRGFRDKTDL